LLSCRRTYGIVNGGSEQGRIHEFSKKKARSQESGDGNSSVGPGQRLYELVILSSDRSWTKCKYWWTIFSLLL